MSAKAPRLTNSRFEVDHWRDFSHARGVRSKRKKQTVSQSPQFSKLAAHTFICRRASYHPLSHKASDKAWSFPSRFLSDSSAPIVTPNACLASMP